MHLRGVATSGTKTQSPKKALVGPRAAHHVLGGIRVDLQGWSSTLPTDYASMCTPRGSVSRGGTVLVAAERVAWTAKATAPAARSRFAPPRPAKCNTIRREALERGSHLGGAGCGSVMQQTVVSHAPAWFNA